MSMAVNLEMSVEYGAPTYQNVEKTTINTSPSSVPDTQHIGAFRLAGVCIGLMCILQATLNIVLRLFLTCPVAIEMLPTSCYNYSASVYIEQLQSRYDKLAEETQQIKSNYNILQSIRYQLEAEKEKLQTKLSSIAEELKKPGWISFRSSFYYMSSAEKNWIQSRNDCKRRGADLVIIKNKEEQDFFEMIRRGKQAWIGLTDQATEGVWKWVDGSPLTIDFWLNQEPNNYMGNENCVSIGYKPEDNRSVINVLNTWNDDSCTRNAFWICEKQLL